MRQFGFKKNMIVETATKPIWTHYSIPSDPEYDFLTKQLDLSEEFIEGLKDQHEVPKFERGTPYQKFLIQVPLKVNGQDRSFPFGFAVGKGHLYTFCERKVDFFDKIFAIPIEDKTPQGIIIELLFLVELEFERVVKNISKQIRQKKLNLTTLANKDIIELVELEDTLNNILTSMVPNASLYDKIAQVKIIGLTRDQQEFFIDITLDTKQNIDQARLAVKTVQNIRNAYSTIMTNNLNTIMKILTSVTIILAIPTLISSTYGMNVLLPLQESSYAFGIIVSVYVLSIVSVISFFKWQKWL
jgi:magnesium transporter